jgi:hypothetical protein
VTGTPPTPRRIQPATLREAGGIALKCAFGEWFVEARHPELDALCAPLLEEIDRRRRAGAFDRRSGRDSTGIPARLLDSGHVVQDWRGPAVDGFFAWACRGAAVLADAYGVATPEPVIDSGWSHITLTGGGMAYHNHGGQPGNVQTAATVLYLQLEPAHAATPESGAVSYLSVAGDEELLARPQVGLLTVWPAHIRHRVVAYRGTTERIIIAANVNFRACLHDAGATAPAAKIAPSLRLG